MLLAVLIVNVEFAPLAVGVTFAGLKEQELPLGNPEQLSDTEAVKLLSETTLTLALVVCPGRMGVGTVKAGTLIKKSYKLNASVASVWVMLPEVPVTEMV